ncbi:transposon protein [Musa troglodytarum]|uniref:Transposon protein n=1 Tax=Musa troglodytarum TaxID=320322 RepID=A0A9E7I4K8_9LILI|nr:transposon protein [Musa troglodytarum]
MLLPSPLYTLISLSVELLVPERKEFRCAAEAFESHLARCSAAVSATEGRKEMESLAKSRMDDLLSAEVGKHDYDWLLTPPGTPVSSYSDKQTSKVAPRSRSNARSVSTGKASKASSIFLSVSQSEKDNSAKPARSSSAMRPSMPNAHSSLTHFSHSRQTALLNTSTASVTSKPSTPGHRSNTKMTPFAPSRSSPSRSSQNSRPSSPTVRPQIGSVASTAAAATRSNSRPSTPTRRASSAAAAAAVASANIRSTSPAPRGRAQAQTKPPERATSAGRQRRPGTASTQASSPLVTRGRLQENTSNARSNHKVITASEPAAARRAVKPALKSTTDVKQSTGGIRGTSPFPQSTRSAAQKGRPGRSSELGASTCRSVAHHLDAAVSDDDSRNGDVSNGCNGSVLGSEDIAVSLKSA